MSDIIKKTRGRIAHLKNKRAAFIATHGAPETLDPRLAADLADQTQEIKLLARVLLKRDMTLKNDIDHLAIIASNRLESEILKCFMESMKRVEKEIAHFSTLLGKPKVIIWGGKRGPRLEDASN